jgi:hypothetical protein
MIRKASLLTVLLGVLLAVAVSYSSAAAPKKFPKKGHIVVSYALTNNETSTPVVIPFDTPVQVVGTCTTFGDRGIGQVSLLRAGAVSDFLEWVGLDSTSGAAITEGFSAAPGTKIVFIDFDHTVQIEVNDATSFRVLNTSGSAATGTVTVIW